MTRPVLNFGSRALLAVGAVLLLAAPACAPLAPRSASIAAEPAPLERAAPGRTEVGALVWRGSLHLAPEGGAGDAQLALARTGDADLAAPALSAVFADGSEVSAPLMFNPDGDLVGLRTASPGAPAGGGDVAAEARALADAAVDDGEVDADDLAALLVADAPTVTTASDGRVWRCADPGAGAERCRLIGRAPPPMGSDIAGIRLTGAERVTDGGFALLWSGHDPAGRPAAVVTVFHPGRSGRPARSEVVAELKAPLLPGAARCLAVFAGKGGDRLLILSDEARPSGGARLLSFDWTPRKAPAGRPPQPRSA